MKKGDHNENENGGNGILVCVSTCAVQVHRGIFSLLLLLFFYTGTGH